MNERRGPAAGRRVGIARDRRIRVAHDVLRACIRRGLLSPAHPLVEFELVHSLDLGRNAVREALQLLADEGVLVRRPGRGTLIGRPLLRVPTDEVLAFDDPVEVARERVAVRVVAREKVEISELLGRTLGLAESQVLLIGAVVSVDGEPICVHESYLPAELDGKQFAARFEPVRASFERVTGVALARVVSTVEAIPADPWSAGALAVAPGAPLVLREQVLTSADGRATLLSFTRYRADRVTFTDAIDVPPS